MTESNPEQRQEQERSDLDWIRTNRERVEALAESDREMAEHAQAVLNYLNADDDEFEMFRPGSTPTFYTQADAERTATEVRNALTGEGSNGGKE